MECLEKARVIYSAGFFITGQWGSETLLLDLH